MDKLLKQQPQPLADEKTELFSLMDRFIASIEGYRKEYDTILASETADLKKREDDGRNALNRMAAAQEKAQKDRLGDLNGHINHLNHNIEQKKKETAEKLQQLEEDASIYEKNEKVKLDDEYETRQEEISNYKEIRKHFLEYYREVDNILGKNWSGESVMKQIISNRKFSRTVGNLNDAREILSEKSIDKAWNIRNEIKKIKESVTKTVFCGGKRDELIGRLGELNAKMDSGLALIELDAVTEYKISQQESADRCKAYRSSCNNKKEQAINERDKYIAAQNKGIKKAQDVYQKDIAVMKAEHTKKFGEQKRHYALQLASARANWEDQLAQCGVAFIKKMEEEYPENRFNAWLRQFWIHPRSVEDYNKIDSMQMNTLIGVAELDISSWGKGGYGTAIGKVLSQYIWLFGTNRESAVKAYRQQKIYLPYCISVENGDSILISTDDASEQRAKVVLNAVGMRLLRSVPACMMRFQLFDADGIGAFGHLMALDPANGNNPSEPIVKSIAIGENGKVHSTDISKQIEETKILMDDLSTQLTNYSSIQEFNAKNPLSKQIYRPVLMMNFPSGLRESDIKTLSAMSTNCRRWGFSMVLAQPDKEKNAIKPEMQRFVNELYRGVKCLRMESSAKYLKTMNPSTRTERAAKLYLYGLPENSSMDKIAAEIRQKSVEASSVKIDFAQAKGICTDRTQRYSRKADDGIVVPVGYLEGGQPFKMQFDDKHVHALIMGMTGAGKTNLLHVLMTNLMLQYDPSEVMLYLIDFKYGLDFRIYTQYNLPNFRSISVTNDPEFALAMLEHLEEEQKKRSTQMGSHYQKISDYNADHPDKKMNRIVLIVDELYELVKQAPEDIQKKIIQKIDSFARQSRAFGLHMVISGQDLHKVEKFETIKNQCSTCIALHCGDEQVKMLMGDEGVARMHTIDSSDQGACVFSLSAGKNPQIEHTALLTTKQQKKFLQEIHDHYVAKKQITDVKVLLTKVSDNPNHKIQMFVDQGFLPEPDHNKMYVGDPISLERELNFHPQGNVWVTGGAISEDSNKAANSLMLFSALSLTLEKLKTGNVEIFCTNFNDHPMRSVEEEDNDRFGQVTSNLPKIYKYNTGKQFMASLQFLLNEMDARRNGSKPKNKAIWWFVVRPELMGDPNNSNMVIDLKELLQNGPANNIHVVLWNGDIKQAQAFQLDKSLFKERICLEMTAEESKMVNGAELKPEPSGFKAVLVGRNVMRFRVYDLPDDRWMSSLFARLKNL